MRNAMIVACALLGAGCLALPEDADRLEAARAPSADERIEGMTATLSKSDAMVPCNDGAGGIQVPPPGVCAERTLVVEGRIGLATLDVDLTSDNGGITILPSEGDAWSFRALVRVEGRDEETARRGLDEAWSFSHEEGGEHRIRAGPAPMTPAQLPDVLSAGARVRSTTYELRLPAWVELSIDASTDNGRITIGEFVMRELSATTDNGEIQVEGVACDVGLQTDNGSIQAELQPRGACSWSMATDNGSIRLRVPERRDTGYDLDATTDNGRIDIDLEDGDLSADGSNHERFVTTRYDERDHRAAVTLLTDNGSITVN